MTAEPSDQVSDQVAELHAAGLRLFRAGEWAQAVTAFAALRALTDAYPEVDSLLADARLKIELERNQAPAARLQPRSRRYLAPLAGLALLVLLGGGGAALWYGNRAAPAAPVAVASALSTPTRAAPSATPPPSATPRPSATPAPSPTPAPSVTPPPAAPPRPGALVVDTADGQPLVRMIGTIELIMDASGSMLAKIGNQTKFDIARTAISGLIERLPLSTQVGLRAYGHRRGSDCNDTELVQPVGPLNRAELLTTIAALAPQPDARTPLSLALGQVAADLQAVRSEKLVVLVTDGEETCAGDPADVAAQLTSADPTLRIAVIGFSIEGADARARLSTIAQRGGGQYFDASDTEQLSAALRQAVALSYSVLDQAGKQVYQGALGSVTTLPPGRYTIIVRAGANRLQLNEIEVLTGQSTKIVLEEIGNALRAEAKLPVPIP